MKNTRGRYGSGYVYVMKVPGMDSIYKIGMSKDPSARAITLSAFIPGEFEIIAKLHFRDPVWAEARAHAHFEAWRLEGKEELFRLEDPNLAIDFLKRLQAEEAGERTLTAGSEAQSESREVTGGPWGDDPEWGKLVRDWQRQVNLGDEMEAIAELERRLIRLIAEGREPEAGALFREPLPLRAVLQRKTARGGTGRYNRGLLLGHVAMASYLRTGIFLTAVLRIAGYDGFGNLLKNIGVASSREEIETLREEHRKRAYQEYGGQDA